MGERDIQISISGKLDVIETKKNITKDLDIIKKDLPVINVELFKNNDVKKTNKEITDLKHAVKLLKDEYKGYGVVATSSTRDAKGALTGFEIEIKNALGLITKLKYSFDAVFKNGAGAVSLIDIRQLNKSEQAIAELKNKVELFKATMQQKTAPFANQADLTAFDDKMKLVNHDTENVVQIMKHLALEFKTIQAAGQLKFDSIKTLYADITRANESITKLTTQMNQAQMGGKTATADQLKVQLSAEMVKLKDLEAKKAMELTGLTQKEIQGLEQQIKLEQAITREKDKAALATAKGKDTQSQIQITNTLKAYKELDSAIKAQYAAKNQLARVDTVSNAETVKSLGEKISLLSKEVALKREAIASSGLKSQEQELLITKQIKELKASLAVEASRYLDKEKGVEAVLQSQVDKYKQMNQNKLSQFGQTSAAGAVGDSAKFLEMQKRLESLNITNFKSQMVDVGIQVNNLIAGTKNLAASTKQSDTEITQTFAKMDASYRRIISIQKEMVKTDINTKIYDTQVTRLMQEWGIYSNINHEISKITDSTLKRQLLEAHTNTLAKEDLVLQTEILKIEDSEYKVQLNKHRLLRELLVLENSKAANMKSQPIMQPIVPKEVLVGTTMQMETLSQATLRTKKEFIEAQTAGIIFAKKLEILRQEILTLDNGTSGAIRALAVFQTRLANLGVEAQQEVQALERVRNEIMRVQNLGQKSDKIKYSGYQIDDLKRYAQELNKTGQVLNPVVGQVDRLGNIQSQVTVKIKEGAKAYREYQITTDALTKSVYVLKGELKHVSAKDLGIMGQFEVAMQRFPIWMVATTVYMQMVTALRDSVKYIFEMDAALIELAKVTSLSTAQLETMKTAAINLGIELGHSSVDVMKAMAEFGRVSKNPEDILRLAEVATIAGNVTTMTAQTAAQALNTAMVAFKINAKDSMEILDAWNEIQNNFRMTCVYC
jgi:hypothetical protein